MTLNAYRFIAEKQDGSIFSIRFPDFGEHCYRVPVVGKDVAVVAKSLLLDEMARRILLGEGVPAATSQVGCVIDLSDLMATSMDNLFPLLEKYWERWSARPPEGEREIRFLKAMLDYAKKVVPDDTAAFIHAFGVRYNGNFNKKSVYNPVSRSEVDLDVGGPLLNNNMRVLSEILAFECKR